MDFKSLLSYLGISLEILGILFIIPIFVGLLFQENQYIVFFVPAVVSFIIGFLLDKKFEKRDIDILSLMTLSVMVLLFSSIIGSLPYLLYTSPENALFESISGFTTTGMSVIPPESLPHSFVFWRSFTQWIGGLFAIMLFFVLSSSIGISSYHASSNEEMHINMVNIKKDLKKVIKIYSIYTVFGVLILMMLNMNIFDSVIHSFSAISTGGFSSRNNSIYFYNSPYIDAGLILLMILGSTSFFIHNNIFRKRLKSYINNTESQTFWFLIVVFSILISFSFIYSEPLRYGVFQTFSALTTTGFTNTIDFPNASKFFLAMIMIIGGFSASAAGGLKIIRISILGKSLGWFIRKVIYPSSAAIPLKIKDKVVKSDDLSIVALFSFIYLAVLVLSTTILSILGYNPLDSFFLSASSEGNVGMASVNVSSIP